MAEIAQGYFPDFKIQWSPMEYSVEHFTEKIRMRSGKWQRMGLYPTTGFKGFKSSTKYLNYRENEALFNFLNAKRGSLIPFYYFLPAPAQLTEKTIGSVTAQTKIIAPFKGSTINILRIAGIETAFTYKALNPAAGFYSVFKFDGVSNFVSMGTGGTLASLGTVSKLIIAMWVYIENRTNNNFLLTNEIFNASGISLYIEQTTGVLKYRSSQAGATQTVGNYVLPLNTWTHIIIAKVDADVYLYVNGISLGIIGTVTNAVTATAAFTLGVGSVNTPIGMLQDVQVYHDLQYFTSYAAIIMNGKPIFDPKLAGHWKMDAGFGTTIKDWSGKGKTGTINNAATWVAGEDQISFVSSTGTVIADVEEARERIIAISMNDKIIQGFLPSGRYNSNYPIDILEVN